MSYDLTGKVALVTGSSRGIGRAIVERLARDRAAVVVNYMQDERSARAVVNGIVASKGRAVAVGADISTVAGIKRLFDEAEAAFGGLDVVVANAGAAVIKPALEVTEEDYDTVFNTNAKGLFFTMQEAARRLRDNGRIIAISTGGVRMLIPGNALYLGSKGTVAQFVRTLAQEVGSRYVTVNAVLPGYTETDLLPERDRKVAADASPFKRVGEPRDIADAVAFLASEEARWVTGQELGVGGGVF
jgi:3-oxoacyl-[acyl-carrier protein] reductase